MKITSKTGNLIALKEVSDNDDLMIITQKGKIIRMHSKDIRSMGRNTQGVRIIKLGVEDNIGGVTRVVSEDDEVLDVTDENGNSTTPHVGENPDSVTQADLGLGGGEVDTDSDVEETDSEE